MDLRRRISTGRAVRRGARGSSRSPRDLPPRATGTCRESWCRRPAGRRSASRARDITDGDPFDLSSRAGAAGVTMMRRPPSPSDDEGEAAGRCALTATGPAGSPDTRPWFWSMAGSQPMDSSVMSATCDALGAAPCGVGPAISVSRRGEWREEKARRETVVRFRTPCYKCLGCSLEGRCSVPCHPTSLVGRPVEARPKCGRF
jgi:hypothetical protein